MQKASDTSPATVRQTEARVLTIESLRLSFNKKLPPELIVEAEGVCRTPWTGARLAQYIYVQPPPDGVQEYDFVATPPDGPVPDVLTQVAASDTIENVPSWLRGVRVYAEMNQKEEACGVPGGEFPDPGTPRPVEATGRSDSLSFDEAFRDAIKAIRAQAPNYPDFLLRAVVTEIRGEFGGIQGKSVLYVRVKANL